MHYLVCKCGPPCRLRDQVLTAVSMPVPFDRVVQLDFAFRPGEPASLRLMCEVQGRYANAVLTDASEGVLLAARQIGEAQTRARAVRIGAPYPLPPPPPGVAPRRNMPEAELAEAMAAFAASSESRAQMALPAALAGVVQGASPGLARQLCAAARVPVDSKWAECTQDMRRAVHAAVCDWVRRLAERKFVYTRDAQTGALSVLGSFSEQCDSIHACIDQRYRDAQAGERFEALHARLTQALSAAAKSARNKLGACKKQLGSAEEADATQKIGDMIMANVHCWPAGAGELEAEDWDTGAHSMSAYHILYEPELCLRRCLSV